MDRINEVTGKCFTTLAQLRLVDTAAHPAPEVVYQRMRAMVDSTMRRAADKGFSQQDVGDVGYAIVALIDEMALTLSDEMRQYWLPRLLQLHYFNENTAGEGFFHRLQVLTRDPARGEVLRVYYLCLLFGFQGQYQVRGGEVELDTIQQQVHRTLTSWGFIAEPDLSPHAARPSDRASTVRRNLPLIWVSAAAVVVSLVLYVGLKLSLNGQSADLVEQVSAALAS